MEGQLRKYKNFMTGYKYVYCKIVQQSSPTEGPILVIQKNMMQISKSERINLRQALIEPIQGSHGDVSEDTSGTAEFAVEAYTEGKSSGKRHRHLFRAGDVRERDQWVNALKAAVLGATKLASPLSTGRR